jgi:outer membrane immunogenic protein
MKKVSALAGAVALAMFASPAAAADFAGPRAGVNAGYADDGGEGAFTYAANVGYDFDLGGAIVGVTAELGDSDETGRDIAFGARVGGVVSVGGEPGNVLVYIHGGYTNLNAAGVNFEGVRAGLGAEWAVTSNVYLNTEYRYSNYDSDVDFHQGVVGIGFRF